MEWQGILLIVGAALVFAVLLTVLILLIGRAAARRMQAAGTERLAAAGVEAQRSAFVRSLGVTSLGRAQVRGNGELALTAEELLFLQAVPAREVRIPIDRIVSVDTPKTHLGKWVGGRLLRITWRSDSGEDSIALQVPDLEGWLATLEAVRA